MALILIVSASQTLLTPKGELTRTAFQGNLFASQKTTQLLRASLIFRFVALTTASRSAERVAVLELARVASEAKLSLSTIFSASRCSQLFKTLRRTRNCKQTALTLVSLKIGGDKLANKI